MELEIVTDQLGYRVVTSDGEEITNMRLLDIKVEHPDKMEYQTFGSGVTHVDMGKPKMTIVAEFDPPPGELSPNITARPMPVVGKDRKKVEKRAEEIRKRFTK